MLRNLLCGLVVAFSLPLLSAGAHAAEPSIHDVYQAAEAGKFSEADTMMQQVLQNHPNSAKAHFVQAELMAKEGHLAQAKTELATAERLEPGLPFAKTEAVEKLKARLGSPHTVSSHATNTTPSNTGFPWGIIVLIAGGVAIVVIIARVLTPRPQVMQSQTGGGGYGSAPHNGVGTGYAGPTGQGMGSSILGGLATGAAVGAGMVAGEKLMHSLLDNNSPNTSSDVPDTTSDFSSSQYDMGGDDFGVSDTSSWDDSSGGSDSGWD